MSKIILTGDRPTGRLHIGHYVGSLRRRVELQESGLFDRIFIMIADAQRLATECRRPVTLCNRAGGMIPTPEQVLEAVKAAANGGEQ